ncbi:hypothetical protein SAMN04489724_3272 [Algoriphagus locisalis]|uniref:Uncharacterized protein n=1 Tax=Algoriphagus locisalis TaxID=305507 RepID=A0A1I7CJS6_9BACT|nr:hypothetical protein [Algoriphagus locisalis]SFT99691.1 hypothetical protein SAMN04489724_3272 [Algoriphagus locisalis]
MIIQYDPCEPFRAYNRLEGRPREEELEDSLAAKIHDPLWMLARQYQFGELKGEDAGSAIFAKAAINTVRMSSFTGGNGQKNPYTEDIPLETRVERLIPEIDFKLSAKLGKKFFLLLDEEGLAANPSSPYAAGMYRGQLIHKFPFSLPKIEEEDTAQVTTAKARVLSLQQASSFVRAMAGRALNGRMLWTALGGDFSKINTLVLVSNEAASPDKFILASHKAILLEAAKKWISFVKKELNLPENDQDDSWYEERLEYSFRTTIDEGNTSETELKADEYFHGHLDWFAFDVAKEKESGSNGFDDSVRKREVLTVIPAEASFAGMPNSRWWEMEDGSIDLGNLKASDTDIAKILVTQYALQYSNDWLAIPYDLPTGSFAEVEGILVRDAFGQNYFVDAAHKEGEGWNEWNMYALSVDKDEFEAPAFDKRILLPAVAAKTMESEAIEEIKFIRDEMANMVWGIETRVPNGLGGGMDGYEAAQNLMSTFERLIKEEEIEETIILPEVNVNAVDSKATTYKPQLKYQLGNSVSENWIPFIAIHQQGSNREIHFQRASMPRIIELYEPHAIRPRTQLLRKGINENDNQLTPMYINEEEIPRAGVKLTGTYQRTRWYNGEIVSWYGRRKRTGRGEGSSGLRFDLVLDNKR